VAESDRGAVLLAAHQVDYQLQQLFEDIAPPKLSKTQLKRILEYPGTLSSFAAKADIAYLTRMISKELWESINALRKIRNSVAHPSKPFSLDKSTDQLKKVYDLGPGVPAGINRMALELTTKTILDRMMEIHNPTATDKQLVFETFQEAIEYFENNQELIGIAEEKRRRWELGIGVAIICGLLINYKEELKRKSGADTWLSALRQ
jgi:uncharacterized protein YutE (UPF0331/DUF86 family)